MAITPPYNDIEMKTAWAEDAATTIPSVPVPGVAYRNTALADSTIGTGQQYDSIGRSADWNQLLFKISANIVTMQKGGASLLWISGRNYEQGALVKDPNNAQIYYRLKAGAGTTRPSSDTTNWQLLQSFFMGEGLMLSNNKLNWGVTSTTVSDCNAIKTAGVYRAVSNTKNIPTDVEGASFNGIITCLHSGTILQQIAYETSNNGDFSMNTRISVNSGSTWTAWTRFGVNFTLDWNSGGDYRAGDLVRDTSNSLLYVCTTAVTNSTQRPGLDTTHFKNLAAWLCRDTHGLLPNGTTNEDTLSWGYSGYSIEDCNDILYPGVYYCLSATENIPSAASNSQGILISVANGNPAITKNYILLQLFLQASTNARAYCRLVNINANGVATFNPWRELSQFDSLDFVSGQTYNQGQLVRGSNNVHYVKKTAASVCNTEPNSDSTNFESLAENLIDQGLLVIGNKINWGNCNAIDQTDLNTLTNPGVYYTNNGANQPESNRGFIIVVKSSNGANATTLQFYYNASTNAVSHAFYVRTYTPKTNWSDWTKIGPAEEVPEGNLFTTGDFVFTYRSARDGFLLCNGTTVSRTTYANLFKVIGTKFGAGNGSTTFNLPDFRGKFAQGANGNLGNSIAAGLPNITGSIQIYGVDLSANVGAFSINSESGGYRGGDWQGHGNGNVGFNASTANSIYGASTTVQPPAIALNVLIKY